MNKLINLYNNFLDIGKNPQHKEWESALVRKLNFITLVGTFNIVLTMLIFPFFGIYFLQKALFIFLLFGPITILLNKYLNYIWASYSFFLAGNVILIYMSFLLGMESYFILFYFPLILAVVQLLGRRETLIHMGILLFSYFINVILITVIYKLNYSYSLLPEDIIPNIRVFCIILSAFTGLTFIAIMRIESLKQEELLKSVLKEKEVLLAEVFHRVKNNMNVITSLLSLKKNVSNSNEVKIALDDCRNRVYSMALVHQKIFERKNIAGLDFSEYIKDLIKEISNSFGMDNSTDFEIQTEKIELPLDYAIPVGLIVNELLTNMFKYAKQPTIRLKIKLNFFVKNNEIHLIMRDNGPGLNPSKEIGSESMGFELIRALTDQIDGISNWNSEKGFCFNLKFRSN